MGGSFNPPTLAHFKLMQEALNTQKADKGFFVPVSDAYLRRKMQHSHPPVVLSPKMRIRMLNEMCTDSRMAVCEKEIGYAEARTLPTLYELHEEHPCSNLYFLLGADKLQLLEHLTERHGFLNAFRAILFARDTTSIDSMLKESEILSLYRKRIVTLPQPKGTVGISASRIRKLMMSSESCQHMLCPGVWNLFKRLGPADFPDTINRFRDEYAFLSNRYACPFVWQGIMYSNAEAAFQSSRCADKVSRTAFSNCSAGKATMRGRSIVPPHEWEHERISIMRSILEAKFGQNPCLMNKLKATCGMVLINGNNKHDTLWGIDIYSWEGENLLGKILMDIRDK